MTDTCILSGTWEGLVGRGHRTVVTKGHRGRALKTILFEWKFHLFKAKYYVSVQTVKRQGDENHKTKSYSHTALNRLLGNVTGKDNSTDFQ